MISLYVLIKDIFLISKEKIKTFSTGVKNICMAGTVSHTFDLGVTIKYQTNGAHNSMQPLMKAYYQQLSLIADEKMEIYFLQNINEGDFVSNIK